MTFLIPAVIIPVLFEQSDMGGLVSLPEQRHFETLFEAHNHFVNQKHGVPQASLEIWYTKVFLIKNATIYDFPR